MIVDRLNIRSKIEQPPHPRNNSRQQPHIRKANTHSKALSIRLMSHLNASHHTIHLNRAQVAAAVNNFNAINRTRSQKPKHAIPVIRRTVAKPKGNPLLLIPRRALPAQSARWPMEQVQKRLIKSPQTPKPSRHRNFGHRHLRLMNQLLRKQHPPRLRNRDRRRTKVLKEQTSQLTFPQTQPSSHLFDTVPIAIQSAFSDQSQSPRNRIRSSPPRSHVRSCLRTAAKTRTKPRILRSRRRTKEPAILTLGRTRRTHRSAINPRRRDADEQQAVKTCVPALQRAITNLKTGQFHD